MSATNPYSAGGLVAERAMFFGRDEELKRLRERLSKGDSTAVVGLRRIGKSSLLYQLAARADALPEGVVALYLDLQDAAHHAPLGLLAAALRGLDEKLNGRYGFAPPAGLAGFAAAVRQMAADGCRPVLCLDEVEELTTRPAFDDDFFEALRALGNARALAFVTASGESLDVLLRHGGRTSPFYNLFINLDLAGISDDGARALLRQPFLAAGRQPLPTEYIDDVLALAGRHPFYLQMAAYHLFDLLKDGRVLNRAALREAFARDAERHFRGLWRALSADEQAGVRRLAGDTTAVVPDWPRTRADLLRCGLAEGAAAAPRLFSAVFAEMVESGEVAREKAVRPLRRRERARQAARPATPPLYAYALVALASAVVALIIALLLPGDRFWVFFVALTVVLTFILVLANKVTGGQFLEWLSKLLK